MLAGGSLVDPPERPFKNFRATFGAFTLCSEEPTLDLVLRAIKFPGDAPDGTTSWIRSVLPATVSDEPPKRRADFAPLAFALGAPPRFDQAYAASIKMPGRYGEGVAGVRVDQSCEEVSSAISQLNRGEVPSIAIHELMIDIPASHAGAVVDGFTIEYEIGESSYVLPVDWQMVICDRKRTREHCE